MRLDSRYRRLTTHLYIQDLIAGARVLTLGGLEAGEEELLRARGARAVTRAEPGAALGSGAFDLVLALEVDADEVSRVGEAARGALAPTGTLVMGCESRDRSSSAAGAMPHNGISYFELLDRLSPLFEEVRMVGQAPFAGATLAEYGAGEPEPVLDGTLVERGERVEWYLAIGGPKRAAPRGYAVVQLPAAELGDAEPTARALAGDLEDARAQLAARERGLEELRQAALVQARAVAEARAELEERDSYVAELEAQRGQAERLDEARRRAEVQKAEAEAREREARRELAEAAGKLLRYEAEPAAPVGDAELARRLAELEAENAKLREREEAARSDSWKHLKARSEAEAQAAAVREDTVRKLKDARKLASVELMRAMEEATKKAVGLKDELGRTQRELGEAQQALAEARAGLEAARGESETLRARTTELEAELTRRETALEHAAQAAVHERARAERLVADERRALGERAEARAQAAQAEARAAVLAADVERVRERLAGVEVALRGESERAGAMEEALRRAAVAVATPESGPWEGGGA